jgi:CHAD domain-containing protein
MSRHPTVTVAVRDAVDRSFIPSVEALRALQGAGAQDPLAVHRGRTSVRRLRSNVRVLDGHVEPLPSLRGELGWVGECLGMVRDVDVLSSRVTAAARGVPEQLSGGGAATVALLRAQRRSAEEQLRSAVSSSRFRDLVDELDLLVKEASSSSGDLDARDVVVPRWRAVRDAVRGLDDLPSDEHLHEFRIETKRARYAAELFSPVAGPRGDRFVRRATALQDALGVQHDAVRACDWFLGYGGDDAGLARACGWFAAQAAAERDGLREAWRPAWASLREPKARFW